jgi:pimeloyl-ACP methyl ester carboxylesterase
MLRMALALSLTLLTAPAVAASVGDSDIHSTVRGTGDKTLIFVHGWTCDESSWAGQIPAFTGDYRVVTLDLPGHGKSEAPAQDAFSMDLFAKAVEAVRQEVGADKVVLVGHSMGAVVIREYALDYPQHVAGLVAVDGALDVRPFKDFPGFGPLTPEARKQMVEGMFVPATTPALREQILAMMLGAPESTAVGASSAMFSPALQQQASATIAAPALSVWAGSNAFPNPEATKEVVPDWAQEKFAGTGHFLMMEDPARFNATLRTFLEQRAKF